jgi:hypothetical protein
MNSETREMLASCNSYSQIYREKLNFIQRHRPIHTIRQRNASKDSDSRAQSVIRTQIRKSNEFNLKIRQ